MRSERGGSTLIEILVTLAIIGLLVSLAVPPLLEAKRAARRTACQSNLHAVAVAMRLYLNKSNEVMPVAAQMPSLGLSDAPRIADVLAPYLPGRKALKCPSDIEENFFASEGSSYEYRSMLGGRRVTDSFLTRRWGEAKTPVMHDYKPFHGEPGEPGAMNYLFADGHVGDLE